MLYTYCVHILSQVLASTTLLTAEYVGPNTTYPLTENHSAAGREGSYRFTCQTQGDWLVVF